MSNWIYEILSNDTNAVIHSEPGFETESEAEFFANMYIKEHKVTNYSLRTIEKLEIA